MASKTEVWNMALSHIGVATNVGSATNSDTPAALACGAFSDRSLNELKRRHQWQPFTVFETLALVEECPNKIYSFAYAYPKDCLFFRKILSEVRNDDESTRIPFARGRVLNASGTRVDVIFTDHAEPVGVFTEKDDSRDYVDDFALAWSFRLAYFIAPRLTKGDPFKRQQAMLNNFRVELSNAITMDNRERQIDPYPKSKYERARVRFGRANIAGEVGVLFPNNSVIS